MEIVYRSDGTPEYPIRFTSQELAVLKYAVMMYETKEPIEVSIKLHLQDKISNYLIKNRED